MKTRERERGTWSRRALLAAIGLAMAGGLALVLLALSAPGAGTGFEVIERRVIHGINDIGVGDLDGDGRIERWTVNHSSEQQIFGASPDLGLPQDPALPGFEPDGSPVTADRPVQIFMDGSTFVVAARDGGKVSGSLRIPWTTEVETEGDAEAEALPCDPEPDCTLVRFSVRGAGTARMTPVPPPSDGFPVRLSLDPEVDPQSVALGRLALPAPGHDFAYHSKDRHALVLFEAFDGAGPALFISRGGARGRLDRAHPEARDEFLVRENGGWSDETVARALVKGGCPGRQAAAFDVNRDGLPDIYQVCGRSGGDNSASPNRLYLQQPDGRFREDAAGFGLDLPGSGSFRFWTEPEEDGIRMFWVTDAAAALFEARDGNRFTELWSLPRESGDDSDKLVVTDLDGDTVPDALIFSSLGNLLLPLTPERPAPRSLADLGLPQASSDGSVLDIDGDGLSDVLAVPQGLFLGGAEGGFSQSDLIDLSWIAPGIPTRIAWLDQDSDGDLDLWIATEGGAVWPWPLGGLYRRLPGSLREIADRLFPRHPLDWRAWMAELYDNRLDHGRTQQIPARAGERVEIVLDVAGEPHRYRVMAGAHDMSRFSDTFHDIFVSLPAGTKLVSATADAAR